MAKISVRHGVAHAYGFLFGRLFQVIGLSWLPAVFYAVAATFLLQRMSGAMQRAIPSDAGLLGEYAFFYLLALVAVTAFLGAVIAVPLTREALGRRGDPVAVHFVVGGREARLFFALLRFYAVVTAALLALVVVAGIAVTSASRYAVANNLHFDWAGLHFQTWLNLGAAAVAGAVFLFLATRLGFLLGPVAAVEPHAKLSHAVTLSGGNFWRLVFEYVVVGLPTTLLLLACETTFGGLQMGKTLPSGAQAFYMVDHAHIAIFATILATGLVVLHALFAGASAAAYEELADAGVYESAPAEAPAMHVPAAAFAYAGTREFADMRPGDQRGSMLREDLASQAAAEAAAPVYAEAPAPQPEHMQPVEEHQLEAQAAALQAEEPAHAASQEEAIVAEHQAEQVRAEDVHAAVEQAEAAPPAHEAETQSAEIATGEHVSEAQLPPLDPAAMAAPPHADTPPAA